jgi:hypothetical protein
MIITGGVALVLAAWLASGCDPTVCLVVGCVILTDALMGERQRDTECKREEYVCVCECESE